jgi:hypothetical protein
MRYTRLNAAPILNLSRFSVNLSNPQQYIPSGKGSVSNKRETSKNAPFSHPKRRLTGPVVVALDLVKIFPPLLWRADPAWLYAGIRDF